MSRTSLFASRAIGAVNVMAAVLLAAVTLLTFAMVALRLTPSFHIPDVFDLSRLVLGVAIFWGVAVAAYNGDHIKVDLVYQKLPPRVARVVDIGAETLFAALLVVMSWKMAGYVVGEMHARLQTHELGLRVWPFYFLAWLGAVLSSIMVIGRVIARLLGRTVPGSAGEPHEH